MKLLISAYACAPHQNSEPLVGFAAVVAAAAEHRVWVLTQPRMVEDSRAELDRLGLGGRVTVIGVEPDATENQSGLSALAQTHLRHERWQRNAARIAARLHAEIGFELVHHVTLAAYWMPCGVSRLPIPLVWGPVGGGVVTPALLLPELGRAGLVEELARRVIRRTFLARPAIRRLPARAALTLAQNHETAARMNPRSVRLLNNGIAALVAEPIEPASRSRDIVVVARLDAWKGITLALRAMSRLGPGETRLRIFGQGAERARLEAMAARLDLGGRVVFEGFVPRQEVLRAIATAGVMLHPSLHEEGGGAVSEALTLGTPVVAVDRGGPSLLPDEWPDSPCQLVQPTVAPLLARRLARALEAALKTSPPVRTLGTPPARAFGAELLASYVAAAGASARPGHQPG